MEAATRHSNAARKHEDLTERGVPTQNVDRGYGHVHIGPEASYSGRSRSSRRYDAGARAGVKIAETPMKETLEIPHRLETPMPH